jgi:hypothetical protein
VGTGAPVPTPTATIPAPPEPLTDEIVEQVQADLAMRLDVQVDQIQILSIENRTWPDAGLGCAARKGLYDPQPIPGQLILLGYQDRPYPYHTSLDGVFLYCPDVGKPLDPIK